MKLLSVVAETILIQNISTNMAVN